MKVDLDIRVAELLCSRLCHELVSPVGAINNGIELIEELRGEQPGALPDEALVLIAHSAGQAARRLRLLRLAYGAAGSAGSIGAAEMRQAAEAYFAGSRITLDWHGAALDGLLSQRQGAGKLVLNLVILAEEALPVGGRIEVTRPVPDTVNVLAEGRNAGLRPDSEAAFLGRLGSEEMTPRSVHGFYTSRIAQRFDLPLAMEMVNVNRLLFRFSNLDDPAWIIKSA